LVGDDLEALDRIRYGADLIPRVSCRYGDAESPSASFSMAPWNALQRNDTPVTPAQHPHRNAAAGRQQQELEPELPNNRYRLLPRGMAPWRHQSRRIGQP